MKQKGFTLVELIAVIVILATIAVITVPIVTNVIDKSEKQSAERSAENYIKAVDIAIGAARLDGVVEDGEYIINPEDDQLCLRDDKCLAVEVNGNKPSGTITIKDEEVIMDSIELIVGDYKVIYDVTNETFGGEIITQICRPATAEEVTTGNVPSGNYEYGDEYICDLGDGEERIFFVLEDGDNTTLEKGTTGSAGPGKISLIMDRNFTDGTVSKTLGWCTDGVNDYTKCQNINSKEANPLKHIQNTFGDNVVVSFPTRDQIASANNGSTINLPQWLYINLKGTVNSVSDVQAYSTATGHDTLTNKAYYVNYGGWVGSLSSLTWDGYSGVRPVITILKKQL